jgi:hypothetical protein
MIGGVVLVIIGLLLMDRCAGSRAQDSIRVADEAKGEVRGHTEQDAHLKQALKEKAAELELAREATEKALAELAAAKARVGRTELQAPQPPTVVLAPGAGHGVDLVEPPSVEAAKDVVIAKQGAYIKGLETKVALLEARISHLEPALAASERRAAALEIALKAKQDAQFSHDLLTGGKGAVLGALITALVRK